MGAATLRDASLTTGPRAAHTHMFCSTSAVRPVAPHMATRHPCARALLAPASAPTLTSQASVAVQRTTAHPARAGSPTWAPAKRSSSRTLESLQMVLPARSAGAATLRDASLTTGPRAAHTHMFCSTPAVRPVAPHMATRHLCASKLVQK